jgi:hypothetical protein
MFLVQKKNPRVLTMVASWIKEHYSVNIYRRITSNMYTLKELKKNKLQEYIKREIFFDMVFWPRS